MDQIKGNDHPHSPFFLARWYPSSCFWMGIDHSEECLDKYGLLTKREVQMTGYWPSDFLHVYGPRRSRGP